MLDNHTWMYPAADMQRLGYITLKFSEGQVYARNAIGTAQGDYAVQKNRLCMELRPWGRTCVHLEEDLDGMKVVTSKGYRLALQVQ